MKYGGFLSDLFDSSDARSFNRKFRENNNRQIDKRKDCQKRSK